jgi:phytoene synthase
MTPAANICRETIRRHSKSFALAGALLDRRQRQNAFALYAWCRYADDAVDLAPQHQATDAVQRLRTQLADVFCGAVMPDPVAREFQRVVHERRIAYAYPHELLAGLAMDAAQTSYRSLDELMLYCFRVAGVVGLMMCHVLGIKSERALLNAAQLGMAMQLTNICRDVREDWQRGRLYLPTNLLEASGAPPADLAREELSPALRSAMGAAVAATLKIADDLYSSAAAGFRELGWRAALSTQVAGLVYSAIGRRLARSRYDVWRMRAVVPPHAKLWLVTRAFIALLAEFPHRVSDRRPLALPASVARFRDVIVYS